MKVKQLTDIEAYSSFAEPRLGVFSSREWLSVYGKELKVCGIFSDDDRLIGGFYYLATRRYGLKFIKLPPYTPHCGLVWESDAKNPSSANGFTKEVLNAVSDHLRSEKSSLTVLAFPTAVNDMQPFIWSKYKVVPNYTYRIALQRPLEDIRSDFDPKNRNMIGKALKSGVLLEVNAVNADERFSFFHHSLTSAGANIYQKELKAVFSSFAKSSNSFCISARVEGKLAGLVFCAYDKDNCYYLLGGVERTCGVQGLNNLLVQRAIEHAASLGCTVFDFEGSMLKGVEKFFRGFGAALVPYYTINKGALAIEMALKFKKRELF
jgi:lipid II:glycine glycyltransferase (peptidoglycan interpeptide bridge formation enzyme)